MVWSADLRALVFSFSDRRVEVSVVSLLLTFSAISRMSGLALADRRAVFLDTFLTDLVALRDHEEVPTQERVERADVETFWERRPIDSEETWRSMEHISEEERRLRRQANFCHFASQSIPSYDDILGWRDPEEHSYPVLVRPSIQE